MALPFSLLVTVTFLLRTVRRLAHHARRLRSALHLLRLAFPPFGRDAAPRSALRFGSGLCAAASVRKKLLVSSGRTP